ncbi:hypothetical protein PR048_028721 [Dryococelus australis]|uniref:Uncharacterized protein n=1 Tax=Dryococelus australis TaxID=614101 RepID=A0ABQ9GDX0_9NEOP|nr:hypothetical protein PR048_028721 [Dryococelus australis]
MIVCSIGTITGVTENTEPVKSAVSARGEGCMYNSAGVKEAGKREIPEKTRRPAASSGTIPTCENPGVHLAVHGYVVVLRAFDRLPFGVTARRCTVVRENLKWAQEGIVMLGEVLKGAAYLAVETRCLKISAGTSVFLAFPGHPRGPGTVEEFLPYPRRVPASAEIPPGALWTDLARGPCIIRPATDRTMDLPPREYTPLPFLIPLHPLVQLPKYASSRFLSTTAARMKTRRFIGLKTFNAALFPGTSPPPPFFPIPLACHQTKPYVATRLLVSIKGPQRCAVETLASNKHVAKWNFNILLPQQLSRVVLFVSVGVHGQKMKNRSASSIVYGGYCEMMRGQHFHYSSLPFPEHWFVRSVSLINCTRARRIAPRRVVPNVLGRRQAMVFHSPLFDVYDRSFNQAANLRDDEPRVHETRARPREEERDGLRRRGRCEVSGGRSCRETGDVYLRLAAGVGKGAGGTAGYQNTSVVTFSLGNPVANPPQTPSVVFYCCGGRPAGRRARYLTPPSS